MLLHGDAGDGCRCCRSLKLRLAGLSAFAAKAPKIPVLQRSSTKVGKCPLSRSSLPCNRPEQVKKFQEPTLSFKYKLSKGSTQERTHESCHAIYQSRLKGSESAGLEHLEDSVQRGPCRVRSVDRRIFLLKVAEVKILQGWWLSISIMSAVRDSLCQDKYVGMPVRVGLAKFRTSNGLLGSLLPFLTGVYPAGKDDRVMCYLPVLNYDEAVLFLYLLSGGENDQYYVRNFLPVLAESYVWEDPEQISIAGIFTVILVILISSNAAPSKCSFTIFLLPSSSTIASIITLLFVLTHLSTILKFCLQPQSYDRMSFSRRESN